MRIVFVSPKKELNFKNIDILSLPAARGELEIMNGHAPFLAELVAGRVILKSKAKEDVFDISGGFAEVHNNEVVLLVRDEEK
ncbi:MAG: hypothetical protein ABIB11_00640 [Candidatus Omnitrophota bacterium]